MTRCAEVLASTGSPAKRGTTGSSVLAATMSSLVGRAVTSSWAGLARTRFGVGRVATSRSETCGTGSAGTVRSFGDRSRFRFRLSLRHRLRRHLLRLRRRVPALLRPMSSAQRSPKHSRPPLATPWTWRRATRERSSAGRSLLSMSGVTLTWRRSPVCMQRRVARSQRPKKREPYGGTSSRMQATAACGSGLCGFPRPTPRTPRRSSRRRTFTLLLYAIAGGNSLNSGQDDIPRAGPRWLAGAQAS